MFNVFKRKVIRSWYPDQTVIRDRWGDAQNRALATPEFSPKLDDPRNVLNHMRWGLGLM